MDGKAQYDHRPEPLMAVRPGVGGKTNTPFSTIWQF